MFGFTQSPAACCQSKSQSVYKSHFCGLSCRLKDDYSHSARFLVNRDSTFLSVLGAALSDTPNKLRLCTCCNPLSQPSPLCIDSDVQAYSAAIAVCGLTAKCEDDTEDHSAPRAFLAKGILNYTKTWRDTAIATLNSTGFPTAQTLGYLQNQSANETPNSTIAQAASATANAYSNIFLHLARLIPTKPHPQLATVGFSLGQLIYLRDAVDDLEKDIKNDHYNPLRHRPESELIELANQATEQFTTAMSELPILQHQQVLSDITAQTTAYHQDLLQAPVPSSKKKKSREKKSSSCWDSCDCCCCDIACCDCDCGTSKSSGSCDLCDCGDSCSCCGDCNCCSCN